MTRKISDEKLGRLNLGQYISAKRRAKLDEVKEYEKKYLTRLAKSKTKPKRSSSKKLDHDLISGRLNLSKHVDKKRKELLKKGRKK